MPGAQRPDASPLPTRLRRAEPAEEPAPAPSPAPTGDERSVSEVATAGLFGFLAEFQSGAARAEASTDEPPTEEER